MLFVFSSASDDFAFFRAISLDPPGWLPEGWGFFPGQVILTAFNFA